MTVSVWTPSRGVGIAYVGIDLCSNASSSYPARAAPTAASTTTASAVTEVFDTSLRLGVLELRHRLDDVLGRALEHELPVVLFDLDDGDRHVVLRQADETPRADDGVGHRLVGGDDDVVDGAHLLVLRVVDGFAQDLLLGAPAEDDRVHFGCRKADGGVAGDLGAGRRREQCGNRHDGQRNSVHDASSSLGFGAVRAAGYPPAGAGAGGRHDERSSQARYGTRKSPSASPVSHSTSRRTMRLQVRAGIVFMRISTGFKCEWMVSTQSKVRT